MKKIIFIAIAMFTFSFANAQTSVGGGIIIFGSEFGAEVKADFSVADAISISPSIDYLFIDSPEGVSETMMFFNVDGHYNFEASDAFTVYPLVGLNYFSYSVSFDAGELGSIDGSEGDLGLTVGGGATYGISDSMKLFAELKYMQSDLGISAGLLFSL